MTPCDEKLLMLDLERGNFKNYGLLALFRLNSGTLGNIQARIQEKRKN